MGNLLLYYRCFYIILINNQNTKKTKLKNNKKNRVGLLLLYYCFNICVKTYKLIGAVNSWKAKRARLIEMEIYFCVLTSPLFAISSTYIKFNNMKLVRFKLKIQLLINGCIICPVHYYLQVVFKFTIYTYSLCQ